MFDKMTKLDKKFIGGAFIGKEFSSITKGYFCTV